MRYLLRTAVTTGAMIWLLLFTAVPAGAHASLSASTPAGGAAVEEAPQQVTLSFTEPPDTVLSSVKVLGGSGSFEQGAPRLADGDNSTLVVDLKPLTKGSYTVSWRTVSRVDGHSSAGAFAFGVGEPPEAVAGGRREQTTSKIPSAASRWILYLGLGSLLGAAWMALFAFGHSYRPVARLAWFGFLAAGAGTLGLGAFQFREAGVDLGVFLGSSSGKALGYRAAPLALVGLGFLIYRNNYRPRMMAAGAGGLAAMLAHAAAGHAAVPPNVVAKVGVQWLHFAAVGLWIGGLAALLLGISAAPEEDRRRASKRFSFVAGISIFVVTATGILRAVNEVNGWMPLFESTYGRLVIAKSVLIVGLGALGAFNRFRNLPKAVSAPAGLQKAGRLELAVAVITLALAGMLSTSVPPVSVAAQAEAAIVSVTGTDFARTVEAALTVAPGTAGPNRFKLALKEAGSGDAMEGVSGVILRFSSLSIPGLGESTLEMESTGDGRFEASGSNVSVDGRWRATAAVTTDDNSFDIPLEFSTRATGFTTDTSEVAGQPTIYSITDPQGRQLQVYAQPDQAGTSELHFTLFDTSGTELAVSEILAVATASDEPSLILVTRRFGPGHFVSDVTLKRGRYHFDVTATTEAGESIRFPAEMEFSS
ncbi:copper resistance protein CopC [soil metagenome]